MTSCDISIPEQFTLHPYAKKSKIIHHVNLIIEHNVSVLYNTDTLLCWKCVSNGFLYSITNTLSISSLTQPPDAIFQPPDATF